uniref:UNC93-like protein MFSD11 n=1 Tax=Steinernema glaseri TaxID=37863 RepID=A0A1I7ZBS2_9BILA
MESDLRAICLLGLGFMFIFSAFNSQGFIEIAVLRDKGHDAGTSEKSGYYSLGIIYASFTVSNFLASPIVVSLGSKNAMILGAFCYLSFLLGFLWLNSFLLYLLSAVVGFGAAVIWTGNGAYLTAYARPDTNARNIGIMWAMLQSSLIIGSLFMFVILHHGALVESFQVLYTVFSIVCATGLGVLFFLPKVQIGPIDSQVLREEREHFDDEDIEPYHADDSNTIRVRRDSSSGLSDEGAIGFWADFTRTFLLMKTRKMLYLASVFIFSGLELTFFSGVYTGCLAATKALGESTGLIVAFTVLLLGCGQIMGGLVFGICSQRFVHGKRFPVIALGFIVHLLAFFLTVLNIPMEAPIHPTSSSAWMENPSVMLAVFCGFLLGFADSCWNTQIYSLLGEIYWRNSSAAFAIFKFYQSLAACVSFVYGSMFLLHIQLILLTVSGTVATWAFFVVEKEVAEATNRPVD